MTSLKFFESIPDNIDASDGKRYEEVLKELRNNQIELISSNEK